MRTDSETQIYQLIVSATPSSNGTKRLPGFIIHLQVVMPQVLQPKERI
jgi:hypothetical protein